MRKITTRGYEPDLSATIPASRLLNYLEQLRWEFIQDPESGLVEHLASGHFPVLRGQRIEMVQRVGMDTELELYARVRKVGRNIVSIEHHVIDAQDRSLVAHAIVDGIFLGPNRRPVRIPESFRAVAKLHETLPAPAHILRSAHTPQQDGPLIHTNPERAVYTPIGLETFAHPEAPVEVPFEWNLQVRPSQIDIFSHVNAATYVAMFTDALFEAAQSGQGAFKHLNQASIRRLAIQYQQEATVQQKLVVRVWELVGTDELGCELYRPEDGVTLCLATLHMSHAAALDSAHIPREDAVAKPKVNLAT
ncbi:MAG: acyl-ACP thioesterase [Deltaproteobacteria bacterium]|nr:acyl-ACP thioesterase [Deltaproteobacteria bacterium]